VCLGSLQNLHAIEIEDQGVVLVPDNTVVQADLDGHVIDVDPRGGVTGDAERICPVSKVRWSNPYSESPLPVLSQRHPPYLRFVAAAFVAPENETLIGTLSRVSSRFSAVTITCWSSLGAGRSPLASFALATSIPLGDRQRPSTERLPHT